MMPFDSFHPPTHKMVPYNSMIKRPYSIPFSNECLKHELFVTKTMAIHNGFKETVLVIIAINTAQ